MSIDVPGNAKLKLKMTGGLVIWMSIDVPGNAKFKLKVTGG